MSSSPENKQDPIASPAGKAESQPLPTFKTENIGKWASEQSDPFAMQNQKTAEKKQQQKTQFKKLLPFLIGALIVLIIIIVLVIIGFIVSNRSDTLPQVNNSVTQEEVAQEMVKYQEYLQQIYDENNGDLEAVDRAIQEALDQQKQDSGYDYSIDMKLAELLFLLLNERYYELIERAGYLDPDDLSCSQQAGYLDPDDLSCSQQAGYLDPDDLSYSQQAGYLDPDDLSCSQQVYYYNMLYYANLMIGESDKAQEYSYIQYQISQSCNEVNKGGGMTIE